MKNTHQPLFEDDLNLPLPNWESHVINRITEYAKEFQEWCKNNKDKIEKLGIIFNDKS